MSNEHGAFRFVNVPADRCSIEGDVQGFAALPVRVVAAAGQVAAIDLHLGIAPLRTGLNVGGTAPFPEPKAPRRSHRSDPRRRVESATQCNAESDRRRAGSC